MRELYSFVDHEFARTWTRELIRDMKNPTWSVEVLTRVHAQELAR